VSDAFPRTPKLPEGSNAKAAVTATATIADVTRTPAAKPRVRAAEPKRCVSEAIDRTPKLPKGSAAKVAVTATAPEAGAARTSAATPRVRTAEPW